MAAITLANLRARVLERANMVGTQFVSTTELNSIINGEGAELHDLLVGRFEDQFTISSTFTVASGSNTFDLTTLSPVFFKLRGVDIDEGSGQWAPLRKYEWADRDRRLSSRSFLRARDVRYRLVASKLVFVPEDGAAYNYRVWYVPGYVDLAADGDTFDYPQNWYEFVLAGSAAKCLAKEESDASIQLGLKAQAKARIEAMGANRDAGAPEVIQRVRNRVGYGVYGGYGDDWDD